MPRVVPSQVLQFITTISLRTEVSGTVRISDAKAPSLRAVLDLVEQIPDELLTMDNQAYALLIYAKADIQDMLATWTSNRTAGKDTELFTFSAVPNPLARIRDALTKCPDESPAPGTSELSFITDADFRANLRNDIGAINRALTNGEWKAATVLAGSAAEALLLWALKQHTLAEITNAISALRGKAELSTNPDPNDLDRWNLYEYIQVAENLGVIKPNTAKQTRLAKDFRNFIHPGVAQRLGEKCDRATALSAVAGVEHVVRDLTP